MGWFDYDLYATIGAKLKRRIDAPSDLFGEYFFNHRQTVVNELSQKHPEFSNEIQNISKMMQAFNADNIWDCLINEYNALQGLCEHLKNDTRTLILFSAQYAFMYAAGGEDESKKEGLHALLERTISLEEEPMGFSSLTLLALALWFADYNGFKNRVYQAEKLLIQQGWFEDSDPVEFLNKFANTYMEKGSDYLEAERDRAEKFVRTYCEFLPANRGVQFPFNVHYAFVTTVDNIPQFMFNGTGFVPVDLWTFALRGVVQIGSQNNSPESTLEVLMMLKDSAGRHSILQMLEDPQSAAMDIEKRNWFIALKFIEDLAEKYGWINPEKQAQKWRAEGKCIHCGGEIKGLFGKKCGSCGRPPE